MVRMPFRQAKAGWRPRAARRKATASGWMASGAVRRGARSLRSARGAFSFGTFLLCKQKKSTDSNLLLLGEIEIVREVHGHADIILLLGATRLYQHLVERPRLE